MTRSAVADRPNILFLMTDQQRWDSLGCYGFQAACTPNLDALAAQGAAFENCYVNSPICTPSRASILTGKHVPNHGVYRLHDLLPTTEVLLTRRLQELGYKTALFGKLHVSGARHEARYRHPNDGFDVYEWCLEPSLYMDSPLNGYTRWLEKQNPELCERLRREGRRVLHIPRAYHMTRWAAERAIEFIRERDRSKPFFCMVSIFDPHNPYQGYPLEVEGLVDRAKIPDPVFLRGELRCKPEAVKREHKDGYLGHWCDFSLEDLRQMRMGYHASIAFADMEMGRVLRTLDEEGIAENTLVIFVSDHGDMLGDHQLLAKGAFFYDPCVKVPLLMRWPARIPGGVRVRALVQPHDLASGPWSAGCYSHQAAICVYDNSGISKGGSYWDPPIRAIMVRDHRYKVALYQPMHESDQGPHGMLFDMEADPQELNDLWGNSRYESVRMQLVHRILDWAANHGFGLHVGADASDCLGR